ncbi:MAG: SMC-Scp complex subunit ScpB [bacterium]|nr:SMC-Scp complex subunit ScpB [bacterium]
MSKSTNDKQPTTNNVETEATETHMDQEQKIPTDTAPISAQLEALLFQYGEPIAVGRAAKLLGIEPSACGTAVDELERALNADLGQGLTILRHGSTPLTTGGSSVQLVTKPTCQHIAQALIQDEFRAELSPAGLEVVTLVAYLGPVPRSTVDYIRGVNSSFTLRNLVVRGLVERDPEASRGNLYAYRTTARFLRHLGLARGADLPEYAAYRAKLTALNEQPTTSNPQPTTNGSTRSPSLREPEGSSEPRTARAEPRDNQQQETNEDQRQVTDDRQQETTDKQTTVRQAHRPSNRPEQSRGTNEVTPLTP